MGAEPRLDAGALLRRFEPLIRFTKGEWFYPMDVAPYVRVEMVDVGGHEPSGRGVVDNRSARLRQSSQRGELHHHLQGGQLHRLRSSGGAL